jgi:hypothetical protein
MSNLIVNLQLPQLRMRPIPGVSRFGMNAWYAENGSCNHSRATAVVGVFNRRVKALCAKLTESSKTTMASPSELSAGSLRRIVSFTCGKAIRTSALAHSISFNEVQGSRG